MRWWRNGVLLAIVGIGSEILLQGNSAFGQRPTRPTSPPPAPPLPPRESVCPPQTHRASDHRGAIITAREIIVTQGVTFAAGSDAILPQSCAALDDVADLLNESPGAQLEVQGHTDNVGAPEYNVAISNQRANAVMRHLISRGVAATRLTAKGYGATAPLVPNDTEHNREINRRISLIRTDLAPPPLPPPSAPPATTAPPSGGAASTALGERARRGVVTVEQNGHVVAIGAVLAGDGRILTALSALSGDRAEVRFADGTTLSAAVKHRDRGWDLALLVPPSRRWTEGLSPSFGDPSKAGELLGFALRSSRPDPVPVTLKSFVGARSKDNVTVTGAEVLDFRGGTPVPGGPIVDSSGGAVGILVQLCKPLDTPTCSATFVGAPVSALRNFLATTPPTASIATPWLGLRGEAGAAGTVRGVRILAVATASPADKGGLKANVDKSKSDLITAADGQAVDTPDKLSEIVTKHAVGDRVKLTVYSNGADTPREVVVVLSAPEP